MASHWCRFCGEFGLTDRMVCSSKECQAADLSAELISFGFSHAAVSGPSITVNRSAQSSSRSLHAYAAAIDIQALARSENMSLTEITLA